MGAGLSGDAGGMLDSTHAAPDMDQGIFALDDDAVLEGAEASPVAGDEDAWGQLGSVRPENGARGRTCAPARGGSPGAV